MTKVGDITVKIDTSELSRISKEFRDDVNRLLLNMPVPLYTDTDCIVMECDITTTKDTIEYAKKFMAKYNHFTDVGTVSNTMTGSDISTFEQVKEAVKMCEENMPYSRMSDFTLTVPRFKGWGYIPLTPQHVCGISGISQMGGTPKKQVDEAVTIPIGKIGKFRCMLMQKANKKIALKHPMYFAFSSTTSITECCIKYGGKTYVEIATRHPNDTPNEYIGKSLSFNRAFAKLVDAVNGESEPTVIGISLGTYGAGKAVYVDADHGVWRSIAGADINKGDKLYSGKNGTVIPKKSEQSFYHGDRLENHTTSKEKDTVNIDFECTCGCSPHEMSDTAQRIIGLCEAETKSEGMSKESEESDDITITMSRKEAEELYDVVRKTNGNVDVWWKLFYNLH